jgi:hypothetical protein
MASGDVGFQRLSYFESFPPLAHNSQGTSGTVNQNANEMVNPLYQLSYSEYWLHRLNNVRRMRYKYAGGILTFLVDSV